ncbi:hypothetical protein BCU12_13925 [Vibrio sp. 10N.261.55.A7]|nr:hypothetical protein BCU12_13925 [Vibrio sp. 10N.261.55.A7]
MLKQSTIPALAFFLIWPKFFSHYITNIVIYICKKRLNVCVIANLQLAQICVFNHSFYFVIFAPNLTAPFGARSFLDYLKKRRIGTESNRQD